jgi:hypothetical protein
MSCDDIEETGRNLKVFMKITNTPIMRPSPDKELQLPKYESVITIHSDVPTQMIIVSPKSFYTYSEGLQPHCK